MHNLLLIAAAFAIPAVGFVALRRADAFIIGEEVGLLRLERRLTRQRRKNVSHRFADKNWFRRLDEIRDLRRMLLISGRDVAPSTWLLKIAGWTFAVAAALLALNVFSVITSGSVALPWALAFLLAISVPLVAILVLRLQVVRQRDRAGRLFGELAAIMAGLGNKPPLRNPAMLEASDLVTLVAGWTDDPGLRNIVDGNRWKQMVPAGRALPQSESEWFVLISELYEIPEAARLAEVVRISREQNASDVAARYLRTARDLARERIADLKARNRRQMITQVVPTLGLVASLLILVLSAVAAIHIGG